MTRISSVSRQSAPEYGVGIVQRMLSDAYTEAAQLTIDPAPDTLLRVFMAWKPLERAVDVPTQTLTAPERTGFTVVEWGGCRVN